MVNPTLMFGPYDSKPGTGAMILAIYHQRVPGYAPGGRNYIHVRDVAEGISNALEGGSIGENYILGNENLSYRDVFARIARVVGVPAPRLALPAFVTKGYGLMSSVFGRIFNKTPILSYALARIACDEHYYTARKAVEILGLPRTPIDIAVLEAFQWFKQNGYLNVTKVQHGHNL